MWHVHIYVLKKFNCWGFFPPLNIQGLMEIFFFKCMDLSLDGAYWDMPLSSVWWDGSGQILLSRPTWGSLTFWRFSVGATCLPVVCCFSELLKIGSAWWSSTSRHLHQVVICSHLDMKHVHIQLDFRIPFIRYIHGKTIGQPNNIKVSGNKNTKEHNRLRLHTVCMP